MPFEGNHERGEKKDSNREATERRIPDRRLDDIENPSEAIAKKNRLKKREFLSGEEIEKKMVDELEVFRQEILQKYPRGFSNGDEPVSGKSEREAPSGRSVRGATESELERKPISWEYVAAFFDGEGSINVTARSNSVDMSLTLTQVDRKSLDDIHSLVISANEDVRRTLDGMVPYLRVKDRQAVASLEYLSDSSTGDEYLSIINEETRSGRRAGRNHDGNLPHTRTEGIRIAREESMKQARAVYEEMRRSSEVSEHERLSAIERNKERGIEVRRKILEILESEEKDSIELSNLIERSRHQTNLHLRKLCLDGLAKRSKQSAADPFVYELTEKGRAQREIDSNRKAEG